MVVAGDRHRHGRLQPRNQRSRSDGWGPGYQGGYNLESAILFEFFATLLFVIVILGSTQKAAPIGFAGLAIGVTLLVIHIFGIHITGVSVNPHAAWDRRF